MRKTLQVFRTFEDGRRVPVGRVEEPDGNIVFRYDDEYLAAFLHNRSRPRRRS